MQRHKSHVRDWMTPDPITTEAERSVIGAYDLMRRRSIRRLPVVDAGGQLCGIITLSDIQQVMPFVADEHEQGENMFALAGLSVGEIMTADPITVAPEQAIQQAAQQMMRHKVSGLPVVESGRIVGIITESDIFQIVVDAWTELEAGA